MPRQTPIKGALSVRPNSLYSQLPLLIQYREIYLNHPVILGLAGLETSSVNVWIFKKAAAWQLICICELSCLVHTQAKQRQMWWLYDANFVIRAVGRYENPKG